MFSAQKQRTRDRSRSSQRSSFDLSSSRPTQVSEPAAGTKRLFSNRNSRHYEAPQHERTHDENNEPEAPVEVHSEKRHRSGNWPLPSSPTNSSTSRQPLQPRNAPNSPSTRRPSAQKRPSKFVEGSMNDRVSQKPHTAYIGTDEGSSLDIHALEQATKARPHSRLPHSNISSTGLSEASRHSSIFRFGKSLAATFNPNNWKLFGKQDRAAPEVESETTQQKLLRDRQVKAEKIYAELKQTGHFPNMRAQSVDAFGAPKPPAKHDSGIAFTSERDIVYSRTSMDSQQSVSREDKRKGMVFLEPPSTISNQHRGESPAISNLSTPSKNSFQHFKKASLSNIKKKFHYDNDSESSADLPGLEHSARRVPSRKELQKQQKQQKLVKRVSDLEGKLEAARRQLNQSLAEPLPPIEKLSRGGRKTFVPGAMPTLPSERLLSGYIQHDDDDEDEEEIGKAAPYVFGSKMESMEESRGRSRVVRESEMSPSHFYPPPSPVSKELLQAHDHPMKSVENSSPKTKEKQADHSQLPIAASDVSALTKFSKNQSLCATEHESHEYSEAPSAYASTSVLSASEPPSEDEVTLKPKRLKSISITPQNMGVGTAKNKGAMPMRKPIAAETSFTRKRKSLADDSGVYKPSAMSTSEEGPELEPAKKQNPKRNGVSTSMKKLHEDTTQANPSQPTRAPPPPPLPTAISTSSTLTVEEQASKSIKTDSASSPSSQAKEAQPPTVPARTISRKAVPSTAFLNTSRAGKLKSKVAPNPRARQYGSPPPSSNSFEPNLQYSRSSRILHSTNDGEELGDGKLAIKPINFGRRTSLDTSIPPMPRLPKTVRLPSGEVVEVKLRAPITAPPPVPVPAARSRSRSRGGNVASSSRTSRVIDSSLSSNGVPKMTKIPDLSAGGKGEELEIGGAGEEAKSRVSRSDTKTSFEWPADCF